MNRSVHHPPIDASPPHTQARTLRQAGLLLGGERKLAEFLDIEVWLVSRWLEGLGQPPDIVFLRCAGLIESSNQAATIGNNEIGESDAAANGMAAPP